MRHSCSLTPGFQSTLPRGERPGRADGDHFRNRFQSTLPRGERHYCQGRQRSAVKFQSTLPRGERHRPALTDIDSSAISIHAPTRGATTGSAFIPTVIPISIHAPTRGATVSSRNASANWSHFNPRSHEGSDL